MNSKHPLHKEKLAVEEQLGELYKIQRNSSWIELDVPYKSGYYLSFDLRNDIKNRSDAWVFYECIRLVGKTVWWKDKSFKRKICKGKYEYYQPGFGEISETTYTYLHPAVKKYFSEVRWYHKNWNPYRKTYECNVPSYFFVTKTEPRWITHYKEHDNLIEAEIDELDDYLDSKKFWNVHIWRGYSGAPKEDRVFYSRSDRRHGKQTLHRNIMSGGEDMDNYEYRYGHRHSARYDCW
jgi:hypothetical protein